MSHQAVKEVFLVWGLKLAKLAVYFRKWLSFSSILVDLYPYVVRVPKNLLMKKCLILADCRWKKLPWYLFTFNKMPQPEGSLNKRVVFFLKLGTILGNILLQPVFCEENMYGFSCVCCWSKIHIFYEILFRCFQVLLF